MSNEDTGGCKRERPNSVPCAPFFHLAMERLQRVKIVRKEKAAQIENALVQMAQSGKVRVSSSNTSPIYTFTLTSLLTSLALASHPPQLASKISESRLIQMLEGTESAQTKVKIQRRNYGIDSDDDDNDDDLL